jgi:amino acid transporter
MAEIHPRWRSPWLATALIGVLGAVLCLTVSLGTLVNLTGASLVADYALIALAALVARPTRATEHSPYKMSWWPVPPLLALASLGYVFTPADRAAAARYAHHHGHRTGVLAGRILPQRGKAWHLLAAASVGDPAAEPAASAPTAGSA